MDEQVGGADPGSSLGRVRAAYKVKVLDGSGQISV